MFLDICYLVLVHVIADAVFQSREMGQKKSKELYWWQLHIFIIFGAFIPFYGIGFAAANAAIHGVIDLIIWNIYPLVAYAGIKIEEDGFGSISANTEFPFNLFPEKGEIEALSKVFKYWEDPKFYLFIIIDQVLHILTLVGLYLYGRGMF